MSKEVVPQFIPWLRTGLASYITNQAQNGIATVDSTNLSVIVQLQASGANDISENVPGPEIRLRSPGEVIGIDQSLIVRHDPEPGTEDAESTYLALVEFSAPDLPWRYTPARPADDTPNRLQPWIVLVAVEEKGGTWLETGGSGRLPVLHVKDAAGELPNLEQSWAWAHVHAAHDLKEGVAEALAKSPESFRSRLLCPRRLRPNRSWLACVVPAFEAGRLAGLGLPTVPNAGLAWDENTNGPLDLPVYHYWRFRTGPKGDFESLVRRLKARELPGTTGLRDLDISRPGSGLPVAKNMVISYQGALVAPQAAVRDWPKQHRQELKNALRQKLNAGMDPIESKQPYDALRDDPVVGPPAYARQQAQLTEVPPEGREPLWYGELNTEPQHRVVSSLGTAVIRRDQESLMAAAWEHAASAVEANHLLNQARTAWEVAGFARQHLNSLADEEFIQVISPAMARLRHPSGKTLHGVFSHSALPGGLFSGAFRRLTHNVSGFKKITAGERIPLTGPITQAILQNPVKFVSSWASVRAPVNADIDKIVLQTRAGQSILRDQPLDRDIDFDQVIIVQEYNGDVQWIDRLVADSRAALDPQGTIQAMVRSRITGLSINQKLPASVFIKPVFTTPMYRRLAAISVEYLVPGIGEIPPDTLGLLITNPAFVEAFMAGLNHEMGREFLWREYPTNLSDTWFQYFWNGGAQASVDILPIGNWKANAKLGGNAPPKTPQASLVLLIRSAVLKRYPDMRVYAVEASWEKKDGKDVRREAAQGQVKTPVFTARLTPDITVFGFELDEKTARGSTNPKLHPGYFFVLEQAPGAPRFGLDAKLPPNRRRELRHWKNLSWSHLVEDDAPLPDFIDLDDPADLIAAGPLPANSDEEGAKDAWGEDAAAMARITFQRPVRMLVHADSMLPPPADNSRKDRK